MGNASRYVVHRSLGSCQTCFWIGAEARERIYNGAASFQTRDDDMKLPNETVGSMRPLPSPDFGSHLASRLDDGRQAMLR